MLFLNIGINLPKTSPYQKATFAWVFIHCIKFCHHRYNWIVSQSYFFNFLFKIFQCLNCYRLSKSCSYFFLTRLDWQDLPGFLATGLSAEYVKKLQHFLIFNSKVKLITSIYYQCSFFKSNFHRLNPVIFQWIKLSQLGMFLVTTFLCDHIFKKTKS